MNPEGIDSSTEAECLCELLLNTVKHDADDGWGVIRSAFYLWGHVLPLWMRYPWWIQSKNKVHTGRLDPNRRKRSVFSPWSSISSQYTCLIIKWDKTDKFPYSTNLTELPFSTSAALGHFPSTRVGPTSLGKVPEESPTGLCGSLYYSFSSGSEGWQSVWSHLFYFSCQKVYQLAWIIERRIS